MSSPPPTPTYDQQQIAYTFTCSASAAYGNEFDNLTDMQNYVTDIESKALADTTIQCLIGTDWAPVWGPIVYAKVTTGPTVVADNTMGCYFSPTQNLFVIAIAGTNALSDFDWFSEDFAVSTLVPWASVSPGAGANSGNISTGTFTGLQNLLAMQDSDGQTLLQALSSFIGSNLTGATVAVCGHSLAGALSPCFALYLFENRSQWEPAGTAPHPVSVYATAGPTPGDSTFATYYEGVIAAGDITYSSAYNTCDVVPLAWAPDDLATIPSLYNTKITPTDTPPNEFMGIVACGLAINALAAPPPFVFGGETILKTTVNPYKQVQRTQLQGAFNSNADSLAQFLASELTTLIPPTLNTSFGVSLKNAVRFALQAVFQHTTAYWGDPNATFPVIPVVGLLNIDTFSGEYQLILKNNPPPNAVEIDVTSKAVRKVTGLDLSKIELGALARAAAAAAKKTA